VTINTAQIASVYYAESNIIDVTPKSVLHAFPCCRMVNVLLQEYQLYVNQQLCFFTEPFIVGSAILLCQTALRFL